jgi:hypothetical protein
VRAPLLVPLGEGMPVPRRGSQAQAAAAATAIAASAVAVAAAEVVATAAAAAVVVAAAAAAAAVSGGRAVGAAAAALVVVAATMVVALSGGRDCRRGGGGTGGGGVRSDRQRVKGVNSAEVLDRFTYTEAAYTADRRAAGGRAASPLLSLTNKETYATPTLTACVVPSRLVP